MGKAPPPGVPPVTAVNPFMPPPPIPAPPPPPFFAGPPPAVGVPFNPTAPILLQAEAAGRVVQPCAGPECGAPEGCPPSQPCNCYCQCRPPVPPKSEVFK